MADITPSGMRALILVGGYGTRLRPLTLTTPKPLVPFCNTPILLHQIQALAEAGVTEVILAVAYRSETLKAEADVWGPKLGIKILLSIETEPLGTAGPLALAREELQRDDQPFFVLNSDVTCRFPLRELLSFHRKHGGEGTIMVTQVEQWQRYGVVVYDNQTGLIDQFVEKPKKFVGNRINAGIYIFNKSVLKRIPLQKTSIETQVFPQIASAKQLYAMELEGFWMDIGTPADFIEGSSKYLASLVGNRQEHELLSNVEAAEKGGFSVQGNVMVHPTATIGRGSILGPDVVVGPNCRIGENCRIKRSVILEGASIGCGTFIEGTTIGWRNRVGPWTRMVGCVLGDDISVATETLLNGVKVLPNMSVTTSYWEPQVVM